MTIYTNDEADKPVRQRNFYLTVFVIPALVMAALCGLVFWLSTKSLLQKSETTYGYIFSFTPAFLIYAYNRRNWLKMPDGTYHYIKNIPPIPKLNFNEPAEYIAEYFYSKKEQIIKIVMGTVLVILGLWIFYKKSKTILLPVTSAIFGVYLIYYGQKSLRIKTARLKIAKNGLWTEKLGFVNWDDINFAEVVEEKDSRNPQWYLDIRLKGTKFEEANQPDERLSLTELNDKESVEMVINNSITNYNKLKEQNNI